tara:strand:+ start:611 stop:1048 length:438 start_codon:yes stop_codon:yes gene_type:complete
MKTVPLPDFNDPNGGFPQKINKRKLTNNLSEPLNTRVSVAVADLNEWLRTAETALPLVRNESVKNSLTDMINGLRQSTRRRRASKAKGYEVVNEDGEITVCATLAHAAKVAGVLPKSLQVMLSRGGGEHVRKGRHGAPIVIKRLA